jgi:hypothetical protein
MLEIDISRLLPIYVCVFKNVFIENTLNDAGCVFLMI